MNAPLHDDQRPGYLAETHAVENVSRELADYNLFTEDRALRDAEQREGAGWAEADLRAFGARVGAADYLQLGFDANRYHPEFDTHDRFGNRIDLVSYHPAYHTLMDTALSHGLHSSPWTNPRTGAHVARAAHTYLHTQVEAGHGCPITMTFACIPSIRTTPAIAALWEPKITACEYDPRNVPDQDKQSVTIGMGMTEKQGGSDV
ncbi:MAG: DNA alkylation response protein, partial [Haliea sp.]